MILDKKIPFVYIFQKIKIELAFVLVVGLLFNYLSDKFEGMIPEMPLNVPTFLGTAISVLLSFKMSQSYERRWEARKVWGAIVNDSRTFVIQLKHLTTNANLPVIRQMAFRQIAWCYILGQSLRGTDPMENTERLLDKEDRNRLSGHANKALAIIDLNARSLTLLREQNQLDSYSHIQLDNTIVRLVDAMGKAERINSTVFPATYRMFLHFAIYLFVIVLSIALRNVELMFELPLLVLISAIFLLLEKTASHLQDPFRNRPSDIPVTAIATNIEINIKQLLNEKDVPRPAQPKTFYIL